MKSQEARNFVKTMEVEYNAYNKMINSTVAHQDVQMAEIELEKKAVEAYKKAYTCIGCSHCDDCDSVREFIQFLNS